MTQPITRRTAAMLLGALPASFAIPAVAAAEPTWVTGDVEMGRPDAPVTIYEYASFTCPHCAAFHVDKWPMLKEQYVDTGKVRFILREVYFDRYGLWASMVARCGGIAGYYPMVDRFFGKQRDWTSASNPAEAIQLIGRRAGLSAEQLRACMSDQDYAAALVEDYKTNATEHDVRSTPTFIVNGETHIGNMAFEELAAIIDAEL